MAMKSFWNAVMAWAETLAEYRRRTNQFRRYY